MEIRSVSGEVQATEQVKDQPQVEIARGENGQFLPGQSPNPGGRPKRTEEEKDALEEIKKLAPGVAAKMTELLNAPKVPAIAKVRILEIILERTYGKPETAVKLNADVQSNESARARLEGRRLLPASGSRWKGMSDQEGMDLDIFFDHPEKIGHEVGFTDMTNLQGKWIQKMVFGNKDYTLQAHRGSFKSSCLTVAIAIILVYYPERNIIFLRKTDSDVSEMLSILWSVLNH